MDTPLFLSHFVADFSFCPASATHRSTISLMLSSKNRAEFVLQKHRVIPHALSHPGQEEAGDAIGKDILYKLPCIFVHRPARACSKEALIRGSTILRRMRSSWGRSMDR